MNLRLQIYSFYRNIGLFPSIYRYFCAMRSAKKYFKGLKLLISLGGMSYVVWQMLHRFQSAELQSWLQSGPELWPLILVFLLMLLNWGIESYKWKELLRPIESVSFLQAWYSVHAGLAVALLTPNRVGDFGGRILFLTPGNRLQGTFATWTGNMAQLICTLLFGLLGVIFFLFWQKDALPTLGVGWQVILLASLLLGLLLLLYGALILPKDKLFSRYPKLKRGLAFLQRYRKKQMLEVLLYSALRYIIFSTQYYILLHYFAVHLTPLQAYASIACVYFSMLFLPVLTLFEAPLRGSVALLVMSLFSENVSGIVAASVFLWLLNVGLPALWGTLLWNKVNLKKE